MNKNGARMELHIEWVFEVIGRIFLIIQLTQRYTTEKLYQ